MLLLFGCMSSLYILDINPLLDTYVLQNFPPILYIVFLILQILFLFSAGQNLLYNGIFSTNKEEGHFAICNNMDGRWAH